MSSKIHHKPIRGATPSPGGRAAPPSRDRAAGATRALLGSCLLGALSCGQPDPGAQRAAALTQLPAGFTETLVTTASDLGGPTAMEFSPTGQLWVLEQGGRVKLVRGDGTTHTALTLAVDGSGERGLLGLAFSPTYDGAGPGADFLYLYYTTLRSGAAAPGRNRISRFVVTGAGTTTPTLGGEVVLRELPPEDEDNNPATDGDTNHNGGAIHFGPDGKLFVAVGDHNYDTTPQSAHVSQVLSSPFGKILRLNPDGTNPADNPFYTGSASDWSGAIWALGLRNPYTFAFQPVVGRMFINDVGEGFWEEINDGEARANYGWAGSSSPVLEGFLSPAPWTNYRNPMMTYDHSASAPSPFGCAITGGAFYPSGGSFGAAYAGKYFFADFCGSYIRVFDPAVRGSAATPDTSTAFASALTSGSPVDLKVDAAGNLYYLSRGSTGEIYRISASAQTPTITQQPASLTVPVGARASFTVAATGAAPLTYQWQRLSGTTWGNLAGATAATFAIAAVAAGDAGQYRAVVTSGAVSATSNAATLTVSSATQAPTITQQPLTQTANLGQQVVLTVGASGSAPLGYQWERLSGTTWTAISGATAASLTIASVTTADAGQYRARVSNGVGNTTSAAAVLTVNLPPTAAITAPATYTFGQTIAFSATASDPEDGALPASAFTFRVDFGHDTHFHPHLPSFSGSAGGSFVANFNETAPNQFYRVFLTVRDSRGATTTVSRDVQPVRVLLTLASSPAGAPLSLDGQPVSGAVQSVVAMPRTLQAPAAATIAGASYQLVSWSDGGAATHVVTTPAVNTTYTATYRPVTGTARQPGLRAEFFDFTTALSVLPNLTGLTPQISRIDGGIYYASTNGTWTGLDGRFQDTFASRHTGYLRVPTDGTYTLYLNSDDGSRLWLDGTLLIDNDGLHALRDRSGSRALTAGDHALRVEFFENTGGAGLMLSWSGPGVPRQVVPGSAFVRD